MFGGKYEWCFFPSNPISYATGCMCRCAYRECYGLLEQRRFVEEGRLLRGGYVPNVFWAVVSLEPGLVVFECHTPYHARQMLESNPRSTRISARMVPGPRQTQASISFFGKRLAPVNLPRTYPSTNPGVWAAAEFWNVVGLSALSIFSYFSTCPR